MGRGERFWKQKNRRNMFQNWMGLTTRGAESRLARRLRCRLVQLHAPDAPWKSMASRSASGNPSERASLMKAGVSTTVWTSHYTPMEYTHPLRRIRPHGSPGLACHGMPTPQLSVGFRRGGSAFLKKTARSLRQQTRWTLATTMFLGQLS